MDKKLYALFHYPMTFWTERSLRTQPVTEFRCPFIRWTPPYVRPSTKFFSDFNEMLYVDRGR